MTHHIRSQVSLRSVGWRETVVLLGAACLVPVLVWRIPWNGSQPLSVYLLPAFWTTFVALYFYGVVPGLLVGLVAPGLSLLLDGLGAWKPAGALGLEIVFFALIAALMIARWPGFSFTAPLAFLAAKAAAIAVQFFVPAFGFSGKPFLHLAAATQNGLAGLVVLSAINAFLVALHPLTEEWEKE